MALPLSESRLPFLHEDIIIQNILVRLPVKSVGKFRCVSRSWRSLLSNLNFAKSHLNFHIHHEPEGSILLHPPYNNTFFTVNLADQSCTVSRTLTFPSRDGELEYSRITSSCHGLILVVQKKKDNHVMRSWVMKDYGVQDSWTEFSVGGPANCLRLTEVGILGEDEVLFIKEADDDGDGGKEVAPYSRRDGVWRNRINAEFPTPRIYKRMDFIESLISPENLTSA